MIAFFYGGSGSGKSARAEDFSLTLPGKRVYLATMRVFGEEGQARVNRHRAMRADKGFVTVERPVAIESFDPEPGSVVLLECLSNLLANEMFDPEGNPDDAEERIGAGLLRLGKRCQLVVVSNDVFSDGVRYDEDTDRYRAALGRLHGRLAAAADLVTEVICGIPVPRKGGCK